MDSAISLQRLIDRGGLVTIPSGTYTIDRPLAVGSRTKIVCAPDTVLRLSDGADCPLLVNRPDPDGRTRAVAVEGGVWDGNNAAQSRARYAERNPGWAYGQLIVLTGVSDLTLRDMTVKDPDSFGIMLTDTERFTVENILFDCNDKTLNQDGLHVNGWARDGLIRNLKGHTNDDMVALNADEGGFSSPVNDIENIVIDGLYGGGNGWTAVRLLSRNARLRHIVIRNVFGEYKYNVVSFTHWAKDDARTRDYGWFDDIVLENLHAASCRKTGAGHGGLIWVQDDVKHVGTLVIRGVYRSEASDHLNDTCLLQIGDRVRIDCLDASDIHDSVPVRKPTLLMGKDARIGKMIRQGRPVKRL